MWNSKFKKNDPTTYNEVLFKHLTKQGLPGLVTQALVTALSLDERINRLYQIFSHIMAEHNPAIANRDILVALFAKNVIANSNKTMASLSLLKLLSQIAMNPAIGSKIFEYKDAEGEFIFQWITTEGKMVAFFKELYTTLPIVAAECLYKLGYEIKIRNPKKCPMNKALFSFTMNALHKNFPLDQRRPEEHKIVCGAYQKLIFFLRSQSSGVRLFYSGFKQEIYETLIRAIDMEVEIANLVLENNNFVILQENLREFDLSLLNAIHDFRNNKNETQNRNVRSDSNAALPSRTHFSSDDQKEMLLQLVRFVVYELDINNKCARNTFLELGATSEELNKFTPQYLKKLTQLITSASATSTNPQSEQVDNANTSRGIYQKNNKDLFHNIMYIMKKQHCDISQESKLLLVMFAGIYSGDFETMNQCIFNYFFDTEVSPSTIAKAVNSMRDVLHTLRIKDTIDSKTLSNYIEVANFISESLSAIETAIENVENNSSEKVKQLRAWQNNNLDGIESFLANAETHAVSFITANEGNPIIKAYNLGETKIAVLLINHCQKSGQMLPILDFITLANLQDNKNVQSAVLDALAGFGLKAAIPLFRNFTRSPKELSSRTQSTHSFQPMAETSNSNLMLSRLKKSLFNENSTIQELVECCSKIEDGVNLLIKELKQILSKKVGLSHIVIKKLIALKEWNDKLVEVKESSAADVHAMQIFRNVRKYLADNWKRIPVDYDLPSITGFQEDPELTLLKLMVNNSDLTQALTFCKDELNNDISSLAKQALKLFKLCVKPLAISVHSQKLQTLQLVDNHFHLIEKKLTELNNCNSEILSTLKNLKKGHKKIQRLLNDLAKSEANDFTIDSIAVISMQLKMSRSNILSQITHLNSISTTEKTGWINDEIMFLNIVLSHYCDMADKLQITTLFNDEEWKILSTGKLLKVLDRMSAVERLRDDQSEELATVRRAFIQYLDNTNSIPTHGFITEPVIKTV